MSENTQIVESGRAAIQPGEFTPEQISRAQELDREISADLAWADGAKREGKRRFARIGMHLQEMSQGELYRALGYPSMNRYIHQVVSPYTELSYTQLYQCKAVGEYLLPHVAPADVEAMGITKAYQLAMQVKFSGQAPSEEVLDVARNEKKTESDLRTKLAEERGEAEGQPKGRWFDFGFWATNDEIEEIGRAIEIAKRVDPPVSESESDSAQNRAVMLRLCQEFVSTYGGPQG